jgi:hypothetical protein
MIYSEKLLNTEDLNVRKKWSISEKLGLFLLKNEECKSISEAEWPNLKSANLSKLQSDIDYALIGP